MPTPPPVPPTPPVVPPVPPKQHPCVRAVRTVSLNNQDPLVHDAAASWSAPDAFPCRGVPIHITVGPQALVKGIATLRVKAPKVISRIRVTIYGQPGHVTYAETFKGHSLTLPLDVTSAAIFGRNPACGCTYDPNVKITVVATGTT